MKMAGMKEEEQVWPGGWGSSLSHPDFPASWLPLTFLILSIPPQIQLY